MQLSDPQPQLTNRKAPKVLKEGPNRKEEEEEEWRCRNGFFFNAKNEQLKLKFRNKCCSSSHKSFSTS